jgi:hypothetical protein
MSDPENVEGLQRGQARRPVVRLTPRVPPKLPLVRRITINVLRLGVALPITWVYKILFGWWLSGLLERSSEKQLKEDVKRDLSFLFSEFDGRFVPNRQGEDRGKVVMVETSTLNFWLGWDRGEHFISAAPLYAREQLQDLIQLILAIDAKHPIESLSDVPRKPFFLGLADLGQLLRSRFTQIEGSFSKEHYSETVDAIDRIHKLSMQQLADSFNKTGGYFHADIIDPPWKKGTPS